MTRGRICPPHLLVLVVKSRSHHEGHEGSRSLGAGRSRLWFLLNAPSLSGMRRVHAEPTPPPPRRGRTASRAIICRGRRADSPRLTRPSTRPGWPSATEWEGLRQRVEGQLIAVQSPLDACRSHPDGDACRALFKELKNPYFIGDSPALTQTCGWVDAWTAQPSVYAVAARKTAHVVAAVNFARDKNLRLVVKGGGHSYLGGSSAPDSLMIWTRAMNEITVHDGLSRRVAPQARRRSRRSPWARARSGCMLTRP